MRAAFFYLRRTAEGSGPRVVLLPDEFQEVARFEGFVFSALKREHDSLGNVRFFFGFSRGLSRGVFPREDSPLFPAVFRCALGPFSREEGVPFVLARLGRVTSVAGEAAARGQELSAGIPFRLQGLGPALVGRALLSRKGRLSAANGDTSFQGMLSESDGEFEVRWPRGSALFSGGARGSSRGGRRAPRPPAPGQLFRCGAAAGGEGAFPAEGGH